ncbi:MAG: hypothetical protein PPHEINF_1969 [uncultured Paraburkholderia sp.]|nr:MAG: hypothetical protein PPHEINF_1969 [uncultured Paraburkholderia sp.]CAH2784285.1 MAG: hypothetical protein PPHEESC_1871 [uncultured Paraburkholderia sp.]
MVLALHVRLSNGVEFDIGDASVEELTTVVQMLGRMPCVCPEREREPAVL